jgi:hypothetical protein
MLLVAGCGAYNPIANHYQRRIMADGEYCNTDRCYSVEERLSLYEDQRIWTRAEKALLAAAFICQAGDIVTTKIILDDGGTEENPIYGSDPNIALLGAVKLLLTGGVVALADAKPFDRKRLLAGFDVVSCGIFGWNLSQMD